MDLAALRSDARFLVFGDSTNTAFSDTDVDRYINQGYREGVGIAMSINGDWQVRGIYATENIQAGVSKYTLDTSYIKINQVEFKRTATGDYEKAAQIDPNSINEDLETYKPSLPEFDLRDNKIILYQDDDFVDITNGLKIRLQKDVVSLSGTSDEPVLIEPFRNYLSTYAAWKYCIGNEMYKKAKTLKNVLLELEERIKEFYANRSTAKPLILEPAEENNY